MRRVFFLVTLMVALNSKDTNAKNCRTRKSQTNVFLYGFVFESSKVDTLSTCTSKCSQNERCTSINLNLMNMRCELNNSTKIRHPQNMASQTSMIYMEIRDYIVPGSRKDIPISCKWLRETDNKAKSGVYWMKFVDNLSETFRVFCEMTVGGGGWTLVYSYTFTQFNDFRTGANAVTPVPTWPSDRSSGLWSPQSTVTPLSESSYSAMDFALWKKIGSEVLYKSKITNWVACLEESGGLVNWMAGTVVCRVVKAITPTCKTIAPNIFKTTGCGSGLFLDSVSKHYIYFDGRTDSCWPVHDPCGTRSASNHLTNAVNPSGALYIR